MENQNYGRPHGVHINHQRRQSMQLQKSLKLVLLGSVKVGKSTLIRLCQEKAFNSTYKPSTEKSVQAKIPMGKNDKRYHCEVKDIQGLARNESVDDKMVMRQNGIMLVYSIDDHDTFELIQNTLDDLASRVDFDEVAITLVGNKKDLGHKRAVSHEDGQELANEYNINFYELSAKEIGENSRDSSERCPQPFQDMVRRIVEEKDRCDPSRTVSNTYMVVRQPGQMSANNSSNALGNIASEQMIPENPTPILNQMHGQDILHHQQATNNSPHMMKQQHNGQNFINQKMVDDPNQFIDEQQFMNQDPRFGLGPSPVNNYVDPNFQARDDFNTNTPLYPSSAYNPHTNNINPSTVPIQTPITTNNQSGRPQKSSGDHNNQRNDKNSNNKTKNGNNNNNRKKNHVDINNALRDPYSNNGFTDRRFRDQNLNRQNQQKEDCVLM